MRTAFLILIIILLASCSKDKSVVEPGGSERSYYLGFTPFPYDVTQAAVDYSYSKINSDADIAAHHFDDGIPWQEALMDTAFHPNIIAEWQSRKDKTLGKKIYVAVTPINILRNGLAPYKAENTSMPLPHPWDNYQFNHPDVKTAYLNYCRRIIDFFNPDFIAIGIEVNLLIESNQGAAKWNAYLELHKFVFSELKKLYPSLPIMVSFTGMDLVDSYTDADHSLQMQSYNDIINYTDYFGLSMHTFISKFLADSIDSSIFNSVFSLSTKPIAVCETSYPAEEFSINSGTIVFKGSVDKQNEYFEKLFSACDQYSVRFIINFVIRDYDALWTAIGSPDNFQKLWRDTGFYDENVTPRKVKQTWMNKLYLTVN